jgi:hypothetical protein
MFDMRRNLITAMCTLLLGALAASADAQAVRDLDYYRLLAMDRTSMRLKNVALLPVDAGPGQRMVYGDRYGFLRVTRMTDERVTEEWRSRQLEGGIALEVLVEDLDGDGRIEIIARNQEGRIYVYGDDYSLRWESLPEDYRDVTAMVLANVDNDLAYEIILLAEGRLNYIDGQGFHREYQSTQTYQATEMAVGNVDTDQDLEIVLNTGTVIDISRGEPEWETDPFGEIIELMDIDGDGIEEVLAYNLNQIMVIYEVDLREELLLR